MRPRFIAPAIAALICNSGALADQQPSSGFIEDSQLKLLARNMFLGGKLPGTHGDDSHRREWGQVFWLDYVSGYTQGPLGFGLDASAYGLLKLSGGQGHAGRGRVLVPQGDGAADSAATGGAALKARYSHTELKYGNNLRPYNPVFATADKRLFPSTVTGFWLTSSEIKGLDLEAAHLTAGRAMHSTNTDDDLYAAYAGVTTKAADFLGGGYQINDRLGLKLYASRFRDIWRQYYGNANYAYPISGDQNLNVDFNIYRSDDTGQAKAGEIGVTAWSLAGAWTLGAHSLKLSYQKIAGDEPFDYLGIGPKSYEDSILLANSMQLADFNGPHEQSYGAIYKVDMARYGAPGLTLMAHYTQGRDVDGSHLPKDSPYHYADSENHWERGFIARYTVQSGPAKDLKLTLMQSTHRIGNDKSDSSSDLLRVIVEYPYDIL